MTDHTRKAGLPRSFNEYQIKIRITKRPLLLLEGKDDKQFFEKLFNEASQRGYTLAKEISIDTADMIQDNRLKGMGKRDIVEAVCEETPEEILKNKIFCGFVDREFRGFEMNSPIEDTIRDHYVTGSLVWSRGHSLENYCFDFNILREQFEVCSSQISPFIVDIALNILKEIFSSVLHVAGAISLAARDSHYLGVIKNCLDWTNFYLKEGKLSLDTFKCKEILLKTDSTAERVEGFVQKYEFWYQQLATVEQETIRWICHGHIGFSLLWASYALCVYKVSTDTNMSEMEKNKNVQHVLNKRKEERFSICSLLLAKKLLNSELIYPKVVFDRLGVNIA